MKNVISTPEKTVLNGNLWIITSEVEIKCCLKYKNWGILAEVFIFQTTFRHRGGYNTTNMQTKIF
jgi:hypothetical protein